MLKNCKAGNTIIEVLVATAIVGVILTALAYSLGQSVKNSAQAEYRQIATRYAQDGMEFFRQQRTSLQWTAFMTNMPNASTYFCMGNVSTLPLTTSFTVPVAGYPPTSFNAACQINHTSPPVTMYRSVQVVSKITSNPQSIEVVVRVSWLDGTVYRTTSLRQTFRDY